MARVTPKKALGQHFLRDQNIARKIVASIEPGLSDSLIEIGPGEGVLTQFLVASPDPLWLVEIDPESVGYLKEHFPDMDSRVITGDILQLDLTTYAESKLGIIGNFPYNISSQIFFKVLHERNLINQVVGMVQREVAERIAAGPGSKVYGILSVLLQAFYNIEILFHVKPHVFTPPPKVQSSVIRLKRNQVDKLPCSEKLFVEVVKKAFNQRRKTLRNSLQSILLNLESMEDWLKKRPEQLSVPDFIQLTKAIENSQK